LAEPVAPCAPKLQRRSAWSIPSIPFIPSHLCTGKGDNRTHSQPGLSATEILIGLGIRNLKVGHVNPGKRAVRGVALTLRLQRPTDNATHFAITT
jgi:hypothetical protein